MKLCSTCGRDPTRRRQPGKAHQQTTQPWHGTKLNSRWPAVSRVVLYTSWIDLLERRVICIGGIKIERSRDHPAREHLLGSAGFLDATHTMPLPALAERSDSAIGLYSNNRLVNYFFYAALERIVIKAIKGLTWCVRCPVTAVSWTPDCPWHATRWGTTDHSRSVAHSNWPNHATVHLENSFARGPYQIPCATSARPTCKKKKHERY